MTEYSELAQSAQMVAAVIRDQLPVGMGFALIVFEADNASDISRYALISNGKREDVINALRQLLKKAEH